MQPMKRLMPFIIKDSLLYQVEEESQDATNWPRFTWKSGHQNRGDMYVVWLKDKSKGFPYSLPSVGPGADPGVQTVNPQVTISHQQGSRLPLLSARPAVTFPDAEHHCP